MDPYLPASNATYTAYHWRHPKHMANRYPRAESLKRIESTDAMKQVNRLDHRDYTTLIIADGARCYNPLTQKINCFCASATTAVDNSPFGDGFAIVANFESTPVESIPFGPF